MKSRKKMTYSDRASDHNGLSAGSGEFTEKTLRDHGEKFYRAFQHSPVMMSVSETNIGRYIDVNDEFLRVLEYSREEVIGKSSLDLNIFVHPEQREELNQKIRIQNRIQNEFVQTYNKTGKIINLLMSGEIVRIGSDDYLIASAIDITDRARAQKRLLDSEEKYRLLVENSSEAILLAQDGRLKFVNRAMTDMTGYSEEELMSVPFREFIHPEDRDKVLIFYRRHLKNQTNQGAYYIRIVTRDGTVKWAEIHTVTVPWDGKPATLAFLSDITERKKMEDALAGSEARYRTIFENIQDVYYEAAIDGTILEVSPSIEKYTTYRRDELIGLSIHDFYESREERNKLIDLLRTAHKVTDYEIVLKNKGGKIIPCSISSQLIFDAEGMPLKIVGTIRSIEERKKMEETLRASEQRFKTAFYTSPEAININRLEDGLYVDINDGFTRLTGFSREDVIGKTSAEINIWHDLADRQKLVRGLKEKGSYENLEAEFRGKDGSITTALMSAKIIELQGELHILSITREISDRKKAESRQTFVNRLLELINSGYEPDDSIGRIAFLIKEYTGIEAIGLRIRAGEDYPYYEARGFPPEFIEMENFLCSRDDQNEIIRDPDGNPYLECMCGNILKGRTDPSLPFFTPGGSFWSNNTTELLASTTEEDRQARTRNRCNGEGYQSVALIPLRSGDHVIGLLQFNDKRTGCFTLDMIEFFEKIGSAIGIALYRKQAADRLKREEERYRTVADFTYDWEYWLGEDGSYRYVSPAFERITGYPADALIHNPALLEQMISREDRTKVMNHIREPHQYPCPFDFRIIRKNGEERWIGHRCQHVHDHAGRPIGWRGSNRDITDRKLMEVQLIQTQKMEAIGTLAGGIAHDFNNILGAIIGYAEMAQDEVIAGNDTAECIEQILRAGERAKFLVEQILAFSRHAEVEKKLFMIVPLVKEVVKLMRHALPATISIKEALHIRDGFILADPTQIHQVLMNLCTNAGHAMREHGGTLTIGLKQMDFPADQICGHDQLKAGNYLELKVTDTGHGIDPAIIDHIFEPFFTTKKQGEGTGMGLSIVYGIVKSCEGSIHVASQPGLRTTFTVYLPAHESAKILGENRMPKAKTGGSEKILLVEDRDDMLRMLNSMLSRLGYGVTAKQDPLEAVALFKYDPSAFDMIITDQTMPHLTGADMAREVLRIRPNMPIILCTGFSDLVSSEEAKEIGIREFMYKPVTPHELAKTIRKILDHPQNTSGEDLDQHGESSNH